MARAPLRRALIVCLAASFAALPGVSVRAQQAAPAPSHIRVVTAGGLLGQFDGMPEYPGGSFDTEVGPGMHPYGGLAGLVAWRAAHKQPADMFLMTANNLPRDVMAKGAASVDNFLSAVRGLDPFAIAVGTEDFLRGLDNKSTARPGAALDSARAQAPVALLDRTGTAGLLVDWLRQPGAPAAARLPFLLSNAAVRLHKPDLNKIADRGFLLGVSAGDSVGWVKELSFAFPCARRPEMERQDDVSAIVTRQNGGPSTPATVTIDRGEGRGGCGARFSWPGRLQPGSTYAIELRIGGQAQATFTVWTDEALTNDLARVPDRPELPIVMALVDQHVRSLLADAKWRWHDGEGAPCGAHADCEIVILPPVDAFDVALELAEPAATLRPVALLSELSDEDTSAILQHTNRVRLLVLPPDSTALGRAAGRTVGEEKPSRSRPTAAAPPSQAVAGPYSGDLGYGAIVNMSLPAVTQVWTRPEWFGESVTEIEADVRADTGEIFRAAHDVHSVKGRSLCARPPSPEDVKAGRAVNYYLEDWELVNGATVYRDDPAALLAGTAPYMYADTRPDTPYDRAGRFAQAPLWTDRNAFAAAALDSMRTAFKTDLALLPEDAIDENWFTYFHDDPHAPIGALSKLFLERVLFRAGTIVKVRLPASSAVDAISRIVTAGRATGEGFCLSGVNATGCGSPRVSKTDALINGRRIDKNRYYTIALPESVALENGLARYGTDQEDLVYLMDLVLARRTTGVVDSCAGERTAAPAAPVAQAAPGATKSVASLSQRLERARSGENSPYLFLKPADFSFTQTQIREPSDGRGLFNKLGLQNSGAKPSRRISVNFGIDAGIIDTPSWALRGMGSIAYGRALVNGQSSTDPNASLVGLRLDRKVTRGRFFAGYFWESQFSDQVTDVTPTTKGLTGPTLALVTLRRDYKYVSAGFEMEKPQVTRWLSIDPLRISAADGRSAHEHVDIQIDGDSQGLTALQQLGATGLLNRYFAAHPNLSADAVYAFVDRSLSRVRVQADCTPRLSLPFGAKPLELSVATTYRRFVGPNATPLAERQSVAMKVTLAIPLPGLMTLNLTGNEYVAQVNGISGWYTVWQPTVTFSVPVIASRHAGWVY